jgi:hypothetical protein
MTAAGLLLVSFMVADAATPPADTTRADASGLRESFSIVGPWCTGRARVALVLQNTTKSPLRLALESPSQGPIEWAQWFYGDGERLAGVSGIGDGGDPLSYLRSGQGTRLDPGTSASWLVEFGPVPLKPGKGTLTIEVPLVWILNLGHSPAMVDDFTVENFRETMVVTVRRAGQCFAVQRARQELNGR